MKFTQSAVIALSLVAITLTTSGQTVSSGIPGPGERAAASAVQPSRWERRAVPAQLRVQSHAPHVASANVVAKVSEKAQEARRQKQSHVSGHYIVFLQDGYFPYETVLTDGRTKEPVSREGKTLTEVAQVLVRAAGGELVHVFPIAAGGFSALLTPAAAADLQALPDVAKVEAETLMKVDTASWGQDRVNQRTNSPDGQQYTAVQATSVNVYIIDSGVRGTHPEFAGRTGHGVALSGVDPWTDYVVKDTQSGPVPTRHGTHVAGIVAGTNVGIAPHATVHSIRVTDNSGIIGSGTVLSACAWVKNNRLNPAVANMSLSAEGVGTSLTSIDNAVADLIASGVTVVVSAGNGGTDSVGDNANTASPAHLEAAITVGATTSTDTGASFSNWGPVVDLWAPGAGIFSAWGDADNTYNTIDGTSMAAPHVTGVVALFLKTHPSATPEEVRNAVVVNATKNVLSLNSGWTGSNNRLLYVGAGWVESNVNIAEGSGTGYFDLLHPNGNTFDQVLLTGNTVTVHADPGQIVRCSWIDENDDIVQAELSGSGNLTISLENVSGPAAPVKYNQSTQYMKGHASLKLEGATANTYLSVFSVGRANAVNQGLFYSNVSYDGKADLKVLRIEESAAIARILTGNAIFSGSSGDVGIIAPLAKVGQRLIVMNVVATGSAKPYLQCGYPSALSLDGGRPIIAGGNLVQGNSERVNIADPINTNPGFSELYTNANADSHSTTPNIAPQSLSSARLGRGPSSSTALILNFSCGNAGGFTAPASGTTAP